MECSTKIKLYVQNRLGYKNESTTSFKVENFTPINQILNDKLVCLKSFIK